MAGKIVVVQPYIELNYSNLAASAVYDHVHVRDLDASMAREFTIDVRILARNIGSGSIQLFVTGFYPDPSDGLDLLNGTALIGPLSLGTGTPPVVSTATAAAAFTPGHLRIYTKFTQGSGATQLIITYSIKAVLRE